MGKKTLKFNATKMHNKILKQATEMAQEITNSITDEIRTGLSITNINVNEQVENNGVTVNGERIRGMVTCHVLAILYSYGVGTGIDTSNPFFEEYQKSSYWNKWRGNGLSVVTRPNEPYTNIFGEVKYGSGMTDEYGYPVETGLSYKALKVIQKAEEDWFGENGKIQARITIMINNAVANAGSCFSYS